MSYLFNGTTSKLQISSALLSSMPLSFACWFNPSGVTLTETLVEISKSSGAGGEDSYSMKAAGAIANDPIRTFRSNLGTAQAADTVTPGFIASKWNHACAVYTSAALETSYLQGGRPATGTTNITPASLDLTSIGCHASGAANQFFTGKMAEVGIWACALTAGDVRRLAAGVPPNEVRPESLILYLPLRENTLDYSIFNYFLTNTAAVRNSDHPVMYAAQSYRRKYLVDVPAGGGTPTNITLTLATWAWTGRVPTVNAQTGIALAQAAWTWTGQAASVNAKRMITMAQGAWNWFGIPLQGAASTAYQNLMLFFGIEP